MRSGRLSGELGEHGDTGPGPGPGGSKSKNASASVGEEEMALCDQAYPAVLYNAGVYYEVSGP